MQTPVGPMLEPRYAGIATCMRPNELIRARLRTMMFRLLSPRFDHPAFHVCAPQVACRQIAAPLFLRTRPHRSNRADRPRSTAPRLPQAPIGKGQQRRGDCEQNGSVRFYGRGKNGAIDTQQRDGQRSNATDAGRHASQRGRGGTREGAEIYSRIRRCGHYAEI